jgi:hypothetical protein
MTHLHPLTCSSLEACLVRDVVGCRNPFFGSAKSSHQPSFVDVERDDLPSSARIEKLRTEMCIAVGREGVTEVGRLLAARSVGTESAETGHVQGLQMATHIPGWSRPAVSVLRGVREGRRVKGEGWLRSILSTTLATITANRPRTTNQTANYSISTLSAGISTATRVTVSGDAPPGPR